MRQFIIILYAIHLSVHAASFSDEKTIEFSPLHCSQPSMPDHLEEVSYLNDGSLLTTEEENLSIALSTYIKKYIFETTEIPETTLHRTRRLIIKAATICLGIASGIPLMDVAERAAGTLGLPSAPFIIASTIASAFSVSWILSQATQCFDPISEEEKTISKETIQTKIIKHSVANILSAIDTIPATYAIYKYNKIKALSFITIPVVYGFKVCAYYKLFEENLIKKGCSSTVTDDKKALYKYKDKMLDGIDKVFPILISMPPELREQAFKSIFDNKELSPYDFLKRISDLAEKYDDSNEKHTCKKRASKALFSPIYLVNIVKDSVLSYQSTKFLFNSDLFSTIFCLIGIVPGVVLDFIATSKTIDSVHQSFSSKHKSFTETFSPKVKKSLLTSSVVLAALSAPRFAFITYDTLNHSLLSKVSISFTCANLMTHMIFDAFSMRELSDEFVISYYQYFGTQEEKKLIIIRNKLKKLRKLIAYIPPEKLESFMLNLEESKISDGIMESTPEEDRKLV